MVIYVNYERFEKLCIKIGTTPTALSAKLGLSKGNTTSWRKGGNPSVEVLVKVADELDCTIDYLLDRSNIVAFDNKNQLIERDRLVLERYHKADPGIQQAVNKLLDL